MILSTLVDIGPPVCSPLTLSAGNFAFRPPLAFVGLDQVGERRQFGLLRTVLGAAHQCVGAIHEQAMHTVVTLTSCDTASTAPAAVAFFAVIDMARNSGCWVLAGIVGRFAVTVGPGIPAFLEPPAHSRGRTQGHRAQSHLAENEFAWYRVFHVWPRVEPQLQSRRLEDP